MRILSPLQWNFFRYILFIADQNKWMRWNFFLNINIYINIFFLGVFYLFFCFNFFFFFFWGSKNYFLEKGPFCFASKKNEGVHDFLLQIRDRHTYKHGNSLTESAQWGQFSEKFGLENKRESTGQLFQLFLYHNYH